MCLCLLISLGRFQLPETVVSFNLPLKVTQEQIDSVPGDCGLSTQNENLWKAAAVVDTLLEGDDRPEMIKEIQAQWDEVDGPITDEISDCVTEKYNQYVGYTTQ